MIRGRTAVLGATCLVLAGCGPTLTVRVSDPGVALREPESGRGYLLFKPSGYRRDWSWPLVVVCHGGFPDSNRSQLGDWSSLAESRGFLVLVPKLSGRRNWNLPGKRARPTVETNDRVILACLQHVRAGHNVAMDRVFLYGWRGGAIQALRTGLGHPGLFRAISLAGPRFSEELVAPLAGEIDVHQTVEVRYDVEDALTGHHGRDCVAWLHQVAADVRARSGEPVHRHDVRPSLAFFEDVLKSSPWLRMEAHQPPQSSSLTRRFRLRTTVAPVRYHWSFGDGDDSPVAEPIHTFLRPGIHAVSVEIETSEGARHQRKFNVTVP